MVKRELENRWREYRSETPIALSSLQVRYLERHLFRRANEIFSGFELSNDSAKA